jgi:hypothetical protein
MHALLYLLVLDTLFIHAGNPIMAIGLNIKQHYLLFIGYE